jgi:hypothetical protein
MKRIPLILFLVSLVSLSVQAQDPCSLGTHYKNCKACGTAAASNTKGKRLNVLKNRDDKAMNPKKITVEKIRDPANNALFKPSDQVWVRGYVASVVPGGLKETYNCKRSDLRDVHINIVADPSRWVMKLNMWLWSSPHDGKRRCILTPAITMQCCKRSKTTSRENG